jgi:hypothetical protein
LIALVVGRRIPHFWLGPTTEQEVLVRPKGPDDADDAGDADDDDRRVVADDE